MKYYQIDLNKVEKNIKAEPKAGNVFKKLGNMVTPKTPPTRKYKEDASLNRPKLTETSPFQKLKQEVKQEPNPWQKFKKLTDNPKVNYDRSTRSMVYQMA